MNEKPERVRVCKKKMREKGKKRRKNGVIKRNTKVG